LQSFAAAGIGAAQDGTPPIGQEPVRDKQRCCAADVRRKLRETGLGGEAVPHQLIQFAGNLGQGEITGDELAPERPEFG